MKRNPKYLKPRPVMPEWKDIRLCHYKDGQWMISLRHIPTDAYVSGSGESFYELRYRLFGELILKVRQHG